jgi:hypothetical protein
MPNEWDEQVRKKLESFEVPFDESHWHQLEARLQQAQASETGLRQGTRWHRMASLVSIALLTIALMGDGAFNSPPHPSRAVPEASSGRVAEESADAQRSRNARSKRGETAPDRDWPAGEQPASLQHASPAQADRGPNEPEDAAHKPAADRRRGAASPDNPQASGSASQKRKYSDGRKRAASQRTFEEKRKASEAVAEARRAGDRQTTRKEASTAAAASSAGLSAQQHTNPSGAHEQAADATGVHAAQRELAMENASSGAQKRLAKLAPATPDRLNNASTLRREAPENIAFAEEASEEAVSGNQPQWRVEMGLGRDIEAAAAEQSSASAWRYHLEVARSIAPRWALAAGLGYAEGSYTAGFHGEVLTNSDYPNVHSLPVSKAQLQTYSVSLGLEYALWVQRRGELSLQAGILGERVNALRRFPTWDEIIVMENPVPSSAPGTMPNPEEPKRTVFRHRVERPDERVEASTWATQWRLRQTFWLSPTWDASMGLYWYQPVHRPDELEHRAPGLGIQAGVRYHLGR